MKFLILGVLAPVGALYILATVGILIAGALGIAGVEFLILLSIVGMFVIAGLVAGALLIWKKTFGRSRQTMHPNLPRIR